MNPRPLGYEPNELPDCSTPRQSPLTTKRRQCRKTIDYKSAILNRKSKMPFEGLGRVELPTSRLSGVRSNQLSYRPRVSFAPIITQKRATLLSKSAVRYDVDAPEGRVASVANQCLRSTLLPNCERSTSISNFGSEISNPKSDSISEN